MITIYDKDGNPKELDSVDAREHIATGRWSLENPIPPRTSSSQDGIEDQAKTKKRRF